jgi:hypothetical protein
MFGFLKRAAGTADAYARGKTYEQSYKTVELTTVMHPGTPTPMTCHPRFYSHSIVPGGFEVMSYTTRFTPRTSFTIRFEIVFSTS